jgi:orotidine-5'-phosphate decarboxylase
VAVTRARKEIPVRERLMFALDVSTREEAEQWVEKLGDSVVFYKLGLQLLMTPDYFPLVDSLVARGKKVFADIKMFDIPETVSLAMQQLSRSKVTFATVHGQDEMIAAANAAKGGVKILAVTALTSLNAKDAEALYLTPDVQALVLARARRMLELGCDGVISSGVEVPALREHTGEELIVVVPGIRPLTNQDDHKRTVDVEEAFQRGADYIVVGRPIRNAPDPRAAAESIQSRITTCVS